MLLFRRVGLIPRESISATSPLQSTALQPQIRDLAWRIKATAGSRFNAAERLRRRDRSVNILNAFASVAVIFLSIAPAVTKANDLISSVLLLVTIFASLVILVTALIQYASNDAVSAEKMHSCGLELTALRRQLEADDEVSAKVLRKYAADYDRILARYANHESADYQRYRDEHPDEFKDVTRTGVGPGGAKAERALAAIPALTAVALAVGTTFLVYLTIDRQRSATYEIRALDFQAARLGSSVETLKTELLCRRKLGASVDDEKLKICLHAHDFQLLPTPGGP